MSTDTETAAKQDPVTEDPPVAPPADDGESERKRYGVSKAAAEANKQVGEWRPYVTEKGVEHKLVVTDGQRYRCSSDKCVGTDHEWLKSGRSIGGHMRIYHSETVKDFYNEETIAKRVDTNKHARLVGEVIRALEILAPAAQVPLGEQDTPRVKDLEKRVAELEAENTTLRKQADEFEAKQALMREALGL